MYAFTYTELAVPYMSLKFPCLIRSRRTLSAEKGISSLRIAICQHIL